MMELQHVRILECLVHLQWQIEAWQDFQHIYMPCVAILHTCSDQEAGGTPIIAMEINLMLPSKVIHCMSCDTKLIEYEWELCMAQTSDILHELQQLLLVRWQLYKLKEQYGSGQ